MSLTLTQALPLFPTSDVLSAKIRELITGNEDLANKPCAELGKLKVFQLAIELQKIFPDELDSQAMPVAKEILQTIRDLELVEEEQPEVAAPTAQKPLEVKVDLTQDKAITEMSLPELLRYAAEHTDEWAEVSSVLLANPSVSTANRKSEGKFAFKADGGLNIELTLQYIRHLGGIHAVKQRKFKDVRPVALTVALGIEEMRAVEHPLTGKPIQGPDKTGTDYLEDISSDLHEAIIWARRTGHDFWVKLDILTFSQEVTATTLNTRWQTILDDYLEAKSDPDDNTTNGIIRYWTQQAETQDLSGEILNIFNTVSSSVRDSGSARSESDWKRLVLANISFPAIEMHHGASRRLDAEVYPGGQLRNGSSISFSNTILVADLSLYNGSSAKGRVRIARGHQIHCYNSSNDKTSPEYVSWETIARAMNLA